MKKSLVAVVVAALGGGVVALDANRPALALQVAGDAGSVCVIPDCRTLLGRGSWDEHRAPVDCLATGPYSTTGAPVWRGCSVIAREFSMGSACLPAQCEVVSGVNPLAETAP